MVHGLYFTIACVTNFLQQPGLVFPYDNARLHTERAAMNCFQAFPTLPWPARLLCVPVYFKRKLQNFVKFLRFL